MTVAPFPINQEKDDLDFCVRQACKYIAKAMVLAKNNSSMSTPPRTNGGNAPESNEFNNASGSDFSS